jgi:3-deoxy-manno-octulosonate cytidylyltransferase (CMP-KDO synthetase)
MKILGIIPARYASTRFPGKPLKLINGKSMIQRVYEQVSAADLIDKVIVATDDERILAHVEGFGGAVKMTADTHQSGTDRCAEVIADFQNEYDIVINIQGDEPFIQPVQIDSLAQFMIDTDFQIGTLAKLIGENSANIFNSNVVKVIFGQRRAIYFSRHPIPYIRNHAEENWMSHHDYYKHVGMYAFRTKTLLEVAKLKPSDLEKAESLEQLRWLENGYSIGIQTTDIETIGIDTPEDLEKIGH